MASRSVRILLPLGAGAAVLALGLALPFPGAAEPEAPGFRPGAPAPAPLASPGTLPSRGAEPTPPNDIDYVLYFDADVRDAPSCAMKVAGGRIVIDPAVTNPAMSCPDMFSWKLFAEAVRDSFWTWTTDPLLWPQEPLPPCDGTTGDCCTAENPDRNPQCPIFPGRSEVQVGGELSKAHGGSGAPGGEIGRVIRQENAELVFRNRAMYDYVFANSLYFREGVQRVFAAQDSQFSKSAPYHASSGAYLTRIDFPIDAVMIKSNWLEKRKAEALGIRNDPAAPFVEMDILPDADSTTPTPHYLMSFHLSSKDIPNWVWATFEHVRNFGRCDFTGCNDSYGYASPDAVGPNGARNFIRPHVVSDSLGEPSEIFDVGKRYPDDGRASPGLDAVFRALGIGTTPQEPGTFPAPSNLAWRSYRLKGSQVNFTTDTGRPTRLGNSITEGGFMNSSSCMSCHARAAVTEAGAPLLGVFVPGLSEVGYAQSNNGTPDPDWYVQNTAGGTGSPPRILGIQTDFVWGLPFFPSPLAKRVAAGE